MLMPSIFGENLFEDFLDDFSRPLWNARCNAPAGNVMRTDIKESDGEYELTIDLPGCRKEDVKAELKDGYLTVSAQTKKDGGQKDEKGKYIRRERYYGTYSRSFYVGQEVTQEDIRGKFEDGTLKLQVSKKEPQPKVEDKKYISIEG